MAEEKDLRKVWENSPFPVPKLMFAVVESPQLDQDGKAKWIKETYLVVSDEGRILTLINYFGEVFYLAVSRCSIQGDSYFCSGPLFSTSCQLNRERIEFAMKNVVPLFYDSYVIW